MAAARVSVETQNLASLLPVALYGALAALYPLAAGLAHPRQGWMAQAHGNPPVFFAHAAIYAGLLGLFALTLRNADQLSPRMIWLVFGLSALALLFAFPGESLDIFDYLFRGRMLAEYGRSPLRLTPLTLEHAPFYRYITWAAWVDAYGPLWEYASAAVAWMVSHSAPASHATIMTDQSCADQPLICMALIRYVTGYRLLAIAATAWCGVWIARIVPAAQRPRALALFLLNPLTLLSTALGAHNDVLMLAFVLPACALLARCHPERSQSAAKAKSRDPNCVKPPTRLRSNIKIPRLRLPPPSARGAAALGMTSGLLLLGLAAHIKLIALIFMPVALVWLWRRAGLMRTSAAGLLAGALLVLLSWMLYRPLGGWATLTNNLYERSQLSANSIGELLYLYRRYALGIERYQAQIPLSQALTLAFALLTGALLIIWLLRRGRGRSAARSAGWPAGSPCCIS